MESPFIKKENRNLSKENTKVLLNKNYLTIKKIYVVIAAVVIIILAGICSIFIIGSTRNKVEDNLATIEKLSRILLIPQDSPTIGEISDIETLKQGNPDFYKNAEKGDKLILFKEIAVIYREELNLIVNMAAIDTSSE